MPLLIVLPLPPRGLSPNARVHWAQRAKLTAGYRRDAYVLAKAAMISAWEIDLDHLPWTRAVAQATFYWPDRRRRDLRNAEHALKAAYDGIVDSGIIPDDSADVLTHNATRFEVDKDSPRVEITLTSAEK